MKKVKKILGLTEKNPVISMMLDLDNMKIAQFVSGIVIVLESYMIVVYGFLGDKEEQWYYYHVGSYWAFLFVSLLMFIFATCVLKSKIHNHNLINDIGILYCVLTIIWSMLISMVDYGNGKQAFVYITIVLCVAGFSYIRPIISIVLLSFSFGSFYYILFLIDGGKSAVLINYLILWFMVVCLSIARYYMKITDLRAQLELEGNNIKLEEMSLYDNLTKLKNRHCLSIDKESFRDRSLFLMMVDIDNFKLFNDRFGHYAGDSVLEQFSNIFRTNFFVQNVYRMGGEEFLVAVCDCDEEIMLEKIKRCMDDMCKISFEGEQLEVTFSGGYLYKPEQLEVNFAELLRKADDALYKAKRNGKNCIECTELS